MTVLPALNIPSPSVSAFHLGPLTVHIYALCLLTGILVGIWFGEKRAVARGADKEKFENIMLWSVLAGIVGARLYHVITDHQLYFGPGRDPLDAFKIWNGGLGIWGGVAGGAIAAALLCRHYRYDFGTLADVLAPSLLFGQGIGRLGNWFNQELFGRPTTLPWALEIDPAHRPSGYESYETFHPTFLYEMGWNITGGFLLLWAERRFHLGRGRLFCLYAMYYTFGRFFIEAVRIDPANTVGGFRINNWVSLLVFMAALAAFVWLTRARPGELADPFEAPTRTESPATPETSDDPVEKPRKVVDET